MGSFKRGRRAAQRAPAARGRHTGAQMLPLSRRCPDPALNRAISATDRARAANRLTALLTAACALALGLLAALAPMVRSARVKIVEGLRHVG